MNGAPVAAATPPAPAPQGPAPDLTLEGPSRWVTATAETRKTAQWVATALAAVGGVVFGAGPLLARTDLDVSEWSGLRLAVTVVSVVVGALGLMVVIAELVRIQVPIEVTLTTIPKSLRTQIERDPGSYLPGDCTSVAQVAMRLKGFRVAQVELRQQLASTTDAQQRQAIQSAQMAVDHNVEVYRRARSELIAQGGYVAASEAVTSRWKPIATGTVLAALGATCYLLAISGEPPDDTGGGTAQVATLVAYDDGRSDALWEALGLEACEQSDGTVVVLEHSGTGAADDPYQVSTLGEPDGCRAMRFSVIDDVAKLTVPTPEEVTITYERTGDGATSPTDG